MYIAVLHLLYPSLDGGRCVIVGCYNGSRYKKSWKPLPRPFSQNNEWRFDPLPTVLLYSVKHLKIHMWVAAKWETVIEGKTVIQYHKFPASKIFQAHVLTRTGRIIWKTICLTIFDFPCIFDWRLWMNGFVSTLSSGECWYVFNEIQPQYLYGKQFQIAVYSTSN